MSLEKVKKLELSSLPEKSSQCSFCGDKMKELGGDQELDLLQESNSV